MRLILSALLMMFIAAPALAQTSNSMPSTILNPVETEYVCMVNDTVFDNPQIPVEVDGKTYYGCCMGCVSTLQNDTAIRHAIDPVSNNQVDKATATIGAAPDRTVKYFENLENLNSYNTQQ